MASLKARKEQEARIHEQLYSNIQLLTMIYPPTDAFRDVFLQDMFVKSNKAAFQQVIYYLLHILDPEHIKTKIASWPLLDSKREVQFRNEVMKYVTELNSVYEYANIPLLMTSHLISPGGHKFAKFVLKLSQLVMLVHLQKDPSMTSVLLLPVKPRKNTESTKSSLNRVKQRATKLNDEILAIDCECDEYTTMANIEADRISKERKEAKEKLRALKTRPPVFSCDSLVTINMYSDELPALNEALDYCSCIFSKCLKIKELMTYLLGNDTLIKFDSNTFNIPEDVLRTASVGSNINLVSYFEALNSYLVMICLRKPILSSFYLSNKLELYSKTNTWLLVVCKTYQELTEKAIRLSHVENYNVHRNVKSSFARNHNELDSTEILAVPLKESPPHLLF